MIYLSKFLLFILCLCFFYVEAAGKMPGEEEPKNGLGSRRPSAPGLSDLFSLAYAGFVALEERDEEQRNSFNAEIIRLRGLLTTPGIHVVVFDCHGSLTDKKTPESTEGPYRQIVSLYHELFDLGAQVIISSAWENIERVLQSLRAAGIKNPEGIRTEIAVEEPTRTEYTIVHAGNVVSAREEPHMEKTFTNKLEAALWYIGKQGITSIASITLFDDQDTNVRCFMKEEGKIFGVRYPKPQGILIPPYAVLNPE